MTVEEMREYIKNAYPGRNWKARCNMMAVQQVIAVYHSIRERNSREHIALPNKGGAKNVPGYQFTIYDFFKEANNEH